MVAPPISSGHVEALALHLGGNKAHLVERRRDEAGQADDVDLLALGGLEDFRCRHHDAEVDHLVVVALEHDADDVLADVVHIALHRRHQDLAGGWPGIEAGQLLFFFEVGLQIGDRLLHHARGLHHLRQEHLAGAEQVANHVHAGHQRAFDHVQRLVGLLAGFFRVGFDEVGDAVHERMREALLDRRIAPLQILLDPLGTVALESRGRFEQAIGGVVAAVEDDVLTEFAQFGGNVVVNRELARVDDAHVHAGLDGVVEEHRVHRLAHRLVAAEGEREVRDAARNVHQRHLFFDLARRLDESDAVAVVLFDAGRDSEDIGIEDDVFGREADFLRQQLIGALADRDFALDRVGLTLLVERHDDDGRAVAQHLAGLFEELAFAFLHRDRVDDRLALHALEAGFDDASTWSCRS